MSQITDTENEKSNQYLSIAKIAPLGKTTIQPKHSENKQTLLREENIRQNMRVVILTWSIPNLLVSPVSDWNGICIG